MANPSGLLTAPAAARPALMASWWQLWSDRWFDCRNRLLASPAFQRRAAAFPLTRPIARQRASQVFDLVAGFVYSQVLLACVQLRLFDHLAQGPQDLARLSDRTGLPVLALQRLLAAAVSLRLVEARSHGRFGLGVLGAPLVGNTAVLAMVEHHRALYADLADPVALLLGQGAAGQLAAYWPYAAAANPAQLASPETSGYSALMSASQPLVANEILNAYDLRRHRCLLDIGGGEGGFLMQAAASAPHLQLMLFDLPPVAQKATQRFAGAGLADRASATGGDFQIDPLPRGADIATLVRVVHDHDDPQALALLRAARAALPVGGTLLLAEPMAATPGAEAMGDAYFGMYLLAMGSGRPRSPARLTEMLLAAGFEDVRLLGNPLPLQTRILVAKVGTANKADTVGVNLD